MAHDFDTDGDEAKIGSIERFSLHGVTEGASVLLTAIDQVETENADEAAIQDARGTLRQLEKRSSELRHTLAEETGDSV